MMHSRDNQAFRNESARADRSACEGVAATVRSRFESLELLHEGEVVCVFSARRVDDGRLGALKVLTPGAFGHAPTRARLAQQAHALQSLRTPIAVRLVESKLGGPGPYLFLEYVHGHAISVGTPHPAEAAVRVGLAVCQVLRELHGSGFVHRAIEPSHLLVTRDGIRVLGFGHVSEDGHRLTAKGIRVGSLAYAAPEQLRGDRPTPAMDVFALGVVLTGMLTGGSPWRGKTIAGIVAASSSAGPFEDRQLALLPRAWRGLLAAMTHRCADERPGVDEVSFRLAALGDGSPTLDGAAQ